MNEKLKKQYEELKAKCKDALLLFRAGDFYEAYEEDAKTAAKVLGLTLTNGKDWVFAGFPRHSLDTYLPKLVRAGVRVAISDTKLEVAQEQNVEKSADISQTFNSIKKMEVKKIPLAHIEPSPLNPRKTFNEEELKELAANIKVHGLLQPITVRPMGATDTDPMGHFEIVCGERRYRAVKMLDAPEIDCIVKEMNDEQALDAMITENLQRKDVDPIEEAFAFGQLHAHGKSIDEIALRFGKSSRFITERIKLDNLLPELKKFVTKGYMNIGAALHISKLSVEDQRKFYDDYDEEVLDESDPINKSDALEFTTNLFMEIDRAEWSKDFEGSCKSTCEKCQFNNANVGCLFYEMKPHDANCTNRERWDQKRSDWLLQIIKDNADVLVKEGEDLEVGKTVVVEEPTSYYEDKCKDFGPLVEKVKEMGFKVVKKDDYFDRYSYYHESDERLQEKLANNEVYRVLSIEMGWRGTSVSVHHCGFKRNGTEQSDDEVKAMQLVNAYKENANKYKSSVADKLRVILDEINPDELSNEPLTEKESFVFLIMVLRNCSHKFRSANDLMGFGTDKKIIDYAKEHAGDVNKIFREYIRTITGDQSVTWHPELQECQKMILDEWASDKANEIKSEMTIKYGKKQSAIIEKLNALGYDTDGKKLQS